ncbi:MAG: hypothetical protein WD738_15520 [Pirellulales bacterium]
MIGCNQVGAINYLLENNPGRRLELVFGGLESPDLEPTKNYDAAYVLRLGNKEDATWSSDKICLYFREGFLAYKCVVPNEKVDPDEVFRREIESGLQHPPNFPGLMEKVHWGKATSPHVGRLSMTDLESAKDQQLELPSKDSKLAKVRCGIVWNGLPQSVPTRQGYNVLVLFQNVGPAALSDDLLLMGFPIGPVIIGSAEYRDRDGITKGFPSMFGIYGTKIYQFPGKEISLKRAASFRLTKGETTFAWLYVPDLSSYASLQAEFTGLWGADQKGDTLNLRVWNAKSPKVTIPEGDN